MQVLNIASYKFIELNRLSELRKDLYDQCQKCGIKGTILLSKEGINLSLAGEIEAIKTFQDYLKKESCFSDMTYRESYSTSIPFQRLKVKIKKEIITMRCPDVHPEKNRAPAISPNEFKQWLDENHDMIVLDTRNEFEVKCGTFKNAVHLELKDFSEFPQASTSLSKEKPIVMFCTGGIRCEKAAIHLMQSGHQHVYQLDGGILNYFKEVGGAHYEGECFVFDERVALSPNLDNQK